MNLTSLAEKVSAETGLSKAQAFQVVKTTFDVIAYAVSKGEDVRVNNFGTFRLHKSPVSVRRNPSTGETWRSGLKTPKFRASGTFKETVKSGRVTKTISRKAASR